jgi:hypothetical protein
LINIPWRATVPDASAFSSASAAAKNCPIIIFAALSITR